MNWEGSAAVNKGTLDISKVNNLTLTGVTANADEAVIKVTNGGTLAVNENGKLGINDLKTAGTYKIVSVDANSTANFWKEKILLMTGLRCLQRSNRITEIMTLFIRN